MGEKVKAKRKYTRRRGYHDLPWKRRSYCRRSERAEKKRCLRCPKLFTPRNKFNRLCDSCTVAVDREFTKRDYKVHTGS